MDHLNDYGKECIRIAEEEIVNILKRLNAASNDFFDMREHINQIIMAAHGMGMRHERREIAIENEN